MKNIFLVFIFIVCSVVGVNVFAQQEYGFCLNSNGTNCFPTVDAACKSRHGNNLFYNAVNTGGINYSCRYWTSSSQTSWTHAGYVYYYAPPPCESPNQINPVTNVCEYCPSGQFDVFGQCLDDSSSSSSAPPICVPPFYNDPVTGQCVTDPDSSSSSSVSSEGGGGDSSSGGGSSSGGDGDGDNGGGGSSSPNGNPVPPDSTCPNKFQVGDQWYCQSNPVPSSEGSTSSDGSNAAAAGTCGAAPVCDGDPVGCAILLNAHFDRCNTDKKSSGGGDCSAEPACEGDPVGCSIVLQSWKLRCDTGGEEIKADSDLDQYDSDFEGEFGEDKQAPVDGEGALTSLADMSNVVDFDSLDTSGLNINSTGRSGSCPAPRSINLSLGSFEVSYQPLCDFAEQLSSLVVLLFSYMSVLLIWRSTQQG